MIYKLQKDKEYEADEEEDQEVGPEERVEVAHVAVVPAQHFLHHNNAERNDQHLLYPRGEVDQEDDRGDPERGDQVEAEALFK